MEHGKKDSMIKLIFYMKLNLFIIFIKQTKACPAMLEWPLFFIKCYFPISLSFSKICSVNQSFKSCKSIEIDSS
jgi:hypothetical protein